MNKTEMMKIAYQIGFQRALIEAGFDKEAGAVGDFLTKKLPSLFKKTGPKNVAGGAFKKWQKAQNGAKSTQQLMRGVVRPPPALRMRAPSV
jgi:hypothetical protein